MLQQLNKRFTNARAWLKQDPGYIQSEHTPSKIIGDDGLAKLRYYPPLACQHIDWMGDKLAVASQQKTTPLVIVAPLAVNMGIYDLFPQRSFVRYMLAQGFPVYMVDWGHPTRRHDHLHLADYFDKRLPRFLQQVREHSGQQQLSLHGWSLGGLFSYAHTALKNDTDIRNLVLVGSPCDYHASGMLAKRYRQLSHTMNWLRRTTGWRVHRTPRKIWHSAGIANALMFKLTDPIGSVKNYVNLIQQLDNDDFVVKHATNAAFLDHMEAYPGAAVQDMVQYLITDNVMARGRLPMRQRPAVIDQIQASILLITGKQDTIVPPASARALLRQVASQDKTELTINGSHMGIVGGTGAARESWTAIADWLTARDQDESLAKAG